MCLSIGIMLTNACIVYVKMNESYGVGNRDLVSHQNLQKYIDLSLINPTKYRAK